MSSGGVRGKTVMWHKGSTAEHTRKTERSEVSVETQKGGITLMCKRQVRFNVIKSDVLFRRKKDKQ